MGGIINETRAHTGAPEDSVDDVEMRFDQVVAHVKAQSVLHSLS